MTLFIVYYFIPMVCCCYYINKNEDLNVSPKRYLINLFIPFVPILNILYLLQILLNNED